MKKSLIKKKDYNEVEYGKSFTFLPVQRLDHQATDPIDQKELRTALPRVYDIHYVIQFCRILIDKIDKYKTCPKDLPFTLTHSLKKLLAFLEVEKDQMK